ncbi:endoglin [Neoarius graeffei]|uniref:endoglin n=1 Tax=Neoarius graeffei TaxID=443677 RepID=UPI00298BFF90|nr:endoglin [Neoarius graeffei]
METFNTIVALLMIFSAAAASDPSFCRLEGIYGKRDGVITVDELTEGCGTNFVMKNGTEVHILNLFFSSVTLYPIVSVTAAAPAILIVTSPDTHFRTVYIHSKSDIKFYTPSNTSWSVTGQTDGQFHIPPAAHGSELVSWAKDQFGGVSSFTTLYDPMNITFTRVKGTPFAPECQLGWELATMKKSPLVESNVRAVESCLHKKSTDELHIINIPDHVGVRNVSVNVVLSNIKLVLRGPTGTLWKVSSSEVSFVSNNVIYVSDLTVNPKKILSDSDTELQNQALAFFKSKLISSYTKIYLKSPRIMIKIGKRQPTAVTDVNKSTEPPTSYTRMQLFTSPDYTVEIDPNTKVQTNKRIYAQIWSLVHGELVLIIKVKSCLVRSVDVQPVERSVSFKPEPCSACHNNTRFSFSLDMLQDRPSSNWELQCNISHCINQRNQNFQACAEPQLVKKNVQVTPSHITPPNPCFQFSLQSVLGIAFGGFLIGVLLIGALWFIKIRTGYPVALGFSSTGTFFSGCPCSLTKHHAVSTNPSPSENSSANGSMSSTQSTPTSSMA